jgi:hypothetical protein
LKRILVPVMVASILTAVLGCEAAPSINTYMPEAKELLLDRWDLSFNYDLDLIADAEFSGRGLWCNPCLAEKQEELRDDYHFTFLSHKWQDVTKTHIAFNDRSYIYNTVVIHKSLLSAKRGFANAEPYYLWTYKEWPIPCIGDESKGWQGNVYNVDKQGDFEVLVCFRKGVAVVSLKVFAYARQPCPEEIEDFIISLAKIIESKIP